MRSPSPHPALPPRTQWFNATRNYREATIKALDKQVEVFRTLVAVDGGEDYCRQMSRSQLWNIALITARSGEHRLAVELLLRFIKAPQEPGGDPVEIKGDPLLQVVNHILEDGLQSPWPATLVTLASRELWGTKDTVMDLKLFTEALTDHVSNADDPFRVGAKVLMYTKSSGGSESWEAATVKRTKTTQKNTFDLVNWRTHMNIDASKVIAPSSSGLSAAMREAAQLGEAHIVQCMLNAKVDTFNSDEQGNTVLIVASEYGHANVCKLLMGAHQKGRDSRNLKEVRNRKRQNAYDIAVSKKHQEVVRIIQPNDTDDLCKPEDVKAFHDKYFVTDQNVIESVTDSIFKRLEDNEEGSHIGERALEKALRELGLDPSTQQVKSTLYRYDTDRNGLLDKGEFLLLAKDVFEEQGMMWRRNDTPIVAEDYDNGITSLMLACKYGAIDAVRELLLAAPKPNVDQMTTKSGVTALVMAAAFGNLDIVKLLLEHKADANVACEDKYVTPIFYAAQSGFEAIVYELIKAGSADVNAARRKEGDVTKDGRQPLMVAAQHGYWKSAKILIDHKADVNASNHKGETALMFACRYGQTKTASLLLKEGLKVRDETSKRRWTSLHRACANGHHATAEVLLNSCPELLDYPDDKGMTPLMATCGGGQSKIASALIRRGAAVDLENGSGETALWIAAKAGMDDAIKVLTHSKLGRESKLVNQKLMHNGQTMTPVMIAVSHAKRDLSGRAQLDLAFPALPDLTHCPVAAHLSPLKSSPPTRCPSRLLLPSPPPVSSSPLLTSSPPLVTSRHLTSSPLRPITDTSLPCEPSSRSKPTSSTPTRRRWTCSCSPSWPATSSSSIACSSTSRRRRGWTRQRSWRWKRRTMICSAYSASRSFSGRRQRLPSRAQAHTQRSPPRTKRATSASSLRTSTRTSMA